MPLSRLAKKFEDELKVSRKEAWLRMSLFLVFSLVVVVTITATAILFPWRSTITSSTPILPGNYTQVKEVIGDLGIEQDEFLEKAKKAEITFISLEDRSNVYMIQEDGISYRYVQSVSWDWRYYEVTDRGIQDGCAVRTCRPSYLRVFSCVLLSLIIIILFISSSWMAQNRSFYGDVWHLRKP